MKKEYRLRKNEDFQKVIQHKKQYANRRFVIYFKKNNEHLRVGLSVSKKLGNAVTRNKIKRQVRMMAQDVFDTNQKMDYIIIIRKDYLNHSYQDNMDELNKLYNKIDKRMVN